jgi:uncharacterized protein
MTPLAWILAGTIGVALGLLGGGGSILTVPVFTYVLGFGPKQAIAMSLPVVGFAAAAGAVSGLVRGTLPLGPALSIGAATMVGSFAGARLSSGLTGRTQLAMLAVAMLSAAFAMWRRSRRDTGPPQPGAHRHPLLLSAVGLGVGLLTGVVGIGGGFMIVPALVIAGGLQMREAASASLLVITLSAASGLAGYLGHVDFVWPVVVPFALMSAVGVLAGGLAASRVSHGRLQQGFAFFLVILACYILIRG